MSEPLKLCPFCEGKGNIQESDSGMFVHCMKCQCAIGERYDSDAMPDHDFYEKEQAIAAWNTRPFHDALVEMLHCATNNVSKARMKKAVKQANAALRGMGVEP